MVSSKNRYPQTKRLQKCIVRQGKGMGGRLAGGLGEGQRTESWFTGGPFYGEGYRKGMLTAVKAAATKTAII